MARYPKDPAAKLDYKLDWLSWLGDDTISASIWTVPDGITKVSDTFEDTSATVWLSGGEAGRSYTVVNTITTTGGRIEERAIVIEVRNAQFCTVADIEVILGVAVPTAGLASAEAAIAEATAAIKEYCRQALEAVTDDEVVLDGNGATCILLPELPVTSVDSVQLDGEALVVDSDYKVGRHGRLHRTNGAVWTAGVQNVEVTYSHGYDTLPYIIVSVASRAAARRYQAGLRAAELSGVPGVAALSLGDYSVSFGTEAGRGGDGVLGVSAAPILLRSEKEALDPYRIKP
jgi:hypothetical protein